MVSWQREEFKINYNPGKVASTYMLDLAWFCDFIFAKTIRKVLFATKDFSLSGK